MRVEVTVQERSRRHYVFARYPDFGATHGDELPEYRLQLVTPASLGADHRVLILEGEHTPPTLVHITRSEVASTVPLTIGSKVVLDSTGHGSNGQDCCPDGSKHTQACDDHWLTLVGTYRRPSFRTEVVRRSEAWVNPAALLEVSGPEGRTEGWTAMYGTPLTYNGGRLRVGFVLPEIKTYRSNITVLDGGSPVAQARIEVNAPFRYRGFSFYQANADPNDPTWSGLEVVHDPGLPLVYAGLVLTTFGVIYIFAVKPLLTAGVAQQAPDLPRRKATARTAQSRAADDSTFEGTVCR